MSPVTPHAGDSKRLTREVDAAIRALNQCREEREQTEQALAGLKRREAVLLGEVHALCRQLSQALKS